MARRILPLPTRGHAVCKVADLPTPPPKLFRLPPSPSSLSVEEEDDIDDDVEEEDDIDSLDSRCYGSSADGAHAHRQAYGQEHWAEGESSCYYCSPHSHSHEYDLVEDHVASNKKKRKIKTSLRLLMTHPLRSPTYGTISTSSPLYFYVHSHQMKSQLSRHKTHRLHYLSHSHFRPVLSSSDIESGRVKNDDVAVAKFRDIHAKKGLPDKSGFVAPWLSHFTFKFPSSISKSIEHRHSLLSTSDVHHTGQAPSSPQSIIAPTTIPAPNVPPPNMSPSDQPLPQLQPASRLPRQRHRPRPKPGDPIWICQFCEFEDVFGVPPVYLMKLYDINERRERKIKAERKRLLEKAKTKGKKNRAGATAAPAGSPAPTTLPPSNSGVQGTVVAEVPPRRPLAPDPSDPDDGKEGTDFDDDDPTFEPELAPRPVKSKKALAQRLKRQMRKASNVV
ncbi:hypothetical protein V1512DRAFT_261568 [Lipomyces arxii]|uniref:uncharacterized protein n=1 Tax=Lipomyces arxii TaxID=56418 RepID=UPI0034CD1ED4